MSDQPPEVRQREVVVEQRPPRRRFDFPFLVYLFLQVWDKTRLNDDTDTHHTTSISPFCITNDIE